MSAELLPDADTNAAKPEEAAFIIARSVARTRFEDLPAKAVELSKQDILDTIGCSIAGTGAAGGREVNELGNEFGGRLESTVIGFGQKLPAPMAAFINASTGHALDFDDTHDKAVLHVGPAVVSAALALAERVGHVNGKSLITAVALGADVICRMGLATKIPLQQGGWMFSPLYGYFGATVAAGKIIGLNEEQFINAFGIAYCQAAGNLQVNIDDEHALTKRLQIGFAAKGGVMAALLAQKGLTGARKSMEGRWGIYNLHHRGEYHRAALIDGLGEVFEVANLSFKPYSCCRQIHAHVDAALQLRRDYRLGPEDIRSVTLYVNTDPHWLCHPLDLRRHPLEEVHAQFSIPYSVAVALTKGKVLIRDYTLAALKDPDVARVADKVTPQYDASLPTRVIPPARMEIETTDGRKLVSKNVVDAKGHPNNPMSWEELADKFRDCVTQSAVPLDHDKVEQAIRLCRELENLRDAGELMRVVSTTVAAA
jgi:2-methylcitrate dehydratase PrpD